jgi:type IV pilus assembly protein PilB
MNRPESGDWLLQLAIARYPQREALRSVSLPAIERERWKLVCNLAGISAGELAAVVADANGLRTVSPGRPSRALARLIPETMATAFGIVPTAIEEERLIVAGSSPELSARLPDIRFAAGRQVELRIAPPDEVETSRLLLYADATAHEGSRLSQVLDLDDAGIEFTLAGDRELVRFSRALIKQALLKRASDIHIHPFAGGGVVRYRIDGQLERIATIPSVVLVSTIRLLKAQGGMDSTNTMVPQDGRTSLVFQNKRYDIRISTLPASGSEAMVLRILDQSRTFSLEKTNFAPWALQGLKRLASRANGLVLITGPTGSGKTSTLYSVLASLNKSSRRIITVEEPVEYRLVGLSQVEVNTNAGLTFARALRSILRQDPDVLLIGEIRDAETAEIAVQAALTGHLVFSTLHTQDALRAIPRLIELGVPPAMLADTLLGVVSQRLMRQLCPQCKRPTTDPMTPMESLFGQLTGARPAARATGCEACRYTGYFGRFPVVEMIELPDAVRSMMLAGHSDAQALARAMPEGWHSIEHNAANWVISGLSTPEEAFDCFGIRFWTQLAAESGSEASISGALASQDSSGEHNEDVTALIVTPDAARAEAIEAVVAGLGHRARIQAKPEGLREQLMQQRTVQFLVVDLSAAREAVHLDAAELRTSLAWSGLPVLALYDPGETNIVDRMEAIGFSEVVPLPLDPALLEARLEAMLSR